MAHVLKDYDGSCQNIHGHSYELRMTVKGEPICAPANPKNGMVMDLHDLKCLVNDNIISRLDYVFVASSVRPADFISIVRRDFKKIVVVDYQPTSENLIMNMASKLQPLLSAIVALHSIRLQETLGSYVVWKLDEIFVIVSLEDWCVKI